MHGLHTKADDLMKCTSGEEESRVVFDGGRTLFVRCTN